MSRTLSLSLYNLCLPLGILVMAPGALIKMRKRGGRWSDFSERLGRFSEEKTRSLNNLPCESGRFWVHAVSVGEVGIARKIITQLFKASPDAAVLITTTTPTGHELALAFAKQNQGRVEVSFSPLDLPWVPTRVIKAFRPTQIILVEAEVWPNWMNAAHRHQIPVSLVNARLSPRSESRFRFARGLVSPIFQMLDQVLVQEPEDVDRWIGLGLLKDRVHLTGSVKFDPEGAGVNEGSLRTIREAMRCLGWPSNAPVLLAASTHAGEELEMARVFLQLKSDHPGLKLILVPRHVERTTEVLSELRTIGIRPAIRSELKDEVTPSDILLVNTTGELSAWQCMATMVVIGKSFLARGGQNPAEALMAGKPVMFGPHMENFDALVKSLLREGGAVQAPDLASLKTECGRLLKDPNLATRMAATGQRVLSSHSGATARTVERILSLKKI